MYKRAAIGLFALVVLSLLAMFGVSFAAGHALKDSKLEESEGTATLKSTSGAPVTVGISEGAESMFDIPLNDMETLAALQTFTAYVDMTADVSVGGWVAYSAKISAAYKKSDEVAYLETAAGAVVTVDRANQAITIKTAGGVVYPAAAEVPTHARHLNSCGTTTECTTEAVIQCKKGRAGNACRSRQGD